MKHISRQAYAIEVGTIIFTDGYAQVISKEIVGGSRALPTYEFRCVPADPANPATHLKVRADSCAYISTVDHFKERRVNADALKLAIYESTKPNTGTRLAVLHLVSCASKKLKHIAPARDLYCSTWFRLAKRVVEGEPWAILSAKYGLVMPDTVIEPYEETLNGRSRQERLRWAQRVIDALPRADRYVIWAGSAYREFLTDALNAETPLTGLGIGQQLARLKSLCPAVPSAFENIEARS